MRFLKLRRIHFVGAGGVGMSGLAEILLLSTPLEISGCDLTLSENTERLLTLGARIATGHDPRAITAHPALDAGDTRKTYRRGRIDNVSDAFRHEVAEARWLPLEDAPRLLAYRGERDMAEEALAKLERDAV